MVVIVNYVIFKVLGSEILVDGLLIIINFKEVVKLRKGNNC